MRDRRASAQAAPEDADAVILRQRIDILYESLPMALTAIVLGAALTVAVLSRGHPDAVQVGWLATVLAVAGLRLAAYLHFFRGAGRSAPDPLRLGVAVSGVIASALVWGAASLLLFPPEDPEGQVAIAFVIAGITAGAVNTVAPFLTVSLVFTALVLGPLVARLLVGGGIGTGELGPGVALMCLLYWALLVNTGRQLHRTVLEGLKMRFARERAEADLERQAFYDPLTGLPNRRLLMEHLRQDLAFARRHGSFGALAFLDLDRFKTINDSLGHQVGDALLQAVAARLAEEVQEGDTAGRLGGDELLVVFSELAADPVEAAHRARQAAEQIRLALSAPYRIGDHELHATVSIGIALFPIDGTDPDALLRAADTAMYRAKDAGRDTIRFFLPEMQEAAVARMELEKALRRALVDDELKLVFQPQVDGSGRLVAVEALSRWMRGGVLAASPEQFVPLAEETGLIYALGDWVLERACTAMAAIRAAPGGACIARMAVNISPRQFRRRDFHLHLEGLIRRHGLVPSDLELELTEQTLVEDIEDTGAKMAHLRALGVSFAIDDFGTGYSSLAYLNRLPVDALKIDRSFVRDVVSDPSDAAIVVAIVELARHLGLQVVAEGVDSPDIHDFLLAHGCDLYQGFLFHRPMGLPALLALAAADLPATPRPGLKALADAGEDSRWAAGGTV